MCSVRLPCAQPLPPVKENAVAFVGSYSAKAGSSEYQGADQPGYIASNIGSWTYDKHHPRTHERSSSAPSLFRYASVSRKARQRAASSGATENKNESMQARTSHSLDIGENLRERHSRTSTLDRMSSWMRHSRFSVSMPRIRHKKIQRYCEKQLQDEHVVLHARDPADHRSSPQLALPSVPEGFQSMGQFVQHHRVGQDKVPENTNEKSSDVLPFLSDTVYSSNNSAQQLPVSGDVTRPLSSSSGKFLSSPPGRCGHHAGSEEDSNLQSSEQLQSPYALPIPSNSTRQASSWTSTSGLHIPEGARTLQPLYLCSRPIASDSIKSIGNRHGISEHKMLLQPPTATSFMSVTAQKKLQVLALEDGLVEDSPRRDKDAAKELFDVALAGNVKMLRMLLSHPDPLRRIAPDLRAGDGGVTIAVACAQRGLVASCAVLLDAKADPLARDVHPNVFGDGIWPDEKKPDKLGMPSGHGVSGIAGRTLIYLLREKGLFDEVLDMLIPITRTNLIRTISDTLEAFHLKPAIMVAATRNCPRLLDLLLKHGVARSLAPSTDVSRHSSPRSTAFSSSGFSWSSSRVASNDRVEAFWTACVKKHFECSKLLMKGNGIPARDLNAKCDKLGRTALHIAAISGEAEFVRMLLDAGASHTIVSKAGRQALHDACAAGQPRVVAILIKVADPLAEVADMDRKNKDAGRTPLQLAEAYGHKEVSMVLKAQC